MPTDYPTSQEMLGHVRNIGRDNKGGLDILSLSPRTGGFTKIMKALLAKYGITREEFAEMMKVPLSVVHIWCERGRVTSKDLTRIARKLGLSEDEVRDYL